MRAELVVVRWATSGRWVVRVDSGFFEKEIQRFQIFSAGIIAALGTHDALTS